MYVCETGVKCSFYTCSCTSAVQVQDSSPQNTEYKASKGSDQRLQNAQILAWFVWNDQSTPEGVTSLHPRYKKGAEK